jgi:hypothetical protein
VDSIVALLELLMLHLLATVPPSTSRYPSLHSRSPSQSLFAHSLVHTRRRTMPLWNYFART